MSFTLDDQPQSPGQAVQHATVGAMGCPAAAPRMTHAHADVAVYQTTYSGVRFVAGQNMVDLKFPEPVESQYLQHQQSILAAQDLPAAWAYLAMVLPGLLTIILASTVRQDLWTADMASCVPLTATTTPVILAHLLLLYLLEPSRYRAIRCKLIIILRVLFTLSSVCNGLQQCRTVTGWWQDGPESPSSAFMWRAGVIALVWHAAAFRLPFWQHVYVQAVTLMSFAILLADSVCEGLLSIQHGVDIVAAGQQVLGAFWAAVDFMAFAITGGPWLTYDSTPPSAERVCAGGADSCSGEAFQVCLIVVRCWQALIGFGVITAALYCLEARDRFSWWQKWQQQQGLQQQQQ